jgi:hypothetical protein
MVVNLKTVWHWSVWIFDSDWVVKECKECFEQFPLSLLSCLLEMFWGKINYMTCFEMFEEIFVLPFEGTFRLITCMLKGIFLLKLDKFWRNFPLERLFQLISDGWYISDESVYWPKNQFSVEQWQRCHSIWCSTCNEEKETLAILYFPRCTQKGFEKNVEVDNCLHKLSWFVERILSQ